MKGTEGRPMAVTFAEEHGHGVGNGGGGLQADCRGRLKGPGMHWRFESGILVALLRGVVRSGRQMAV